MRTDLRYRMAIAACGTTMIAAARPIMREQSAHSILVSRCSVATYWRLGWKSEPIIFDSFRPRPYAGACYRFLGPVAPLLFSNQSNCVLLPQRLLLAWITLNAHMPVLCALNAIEVRAEGNYANRQGHPHGSHCRSAGWTLPGGDALQLRSDDPRFRDKNRSQERGSMPLIVSSPLPCLCGSGT